MWKLQDLESAVIWSEKERCSSKMKPRLRAEWVLGGAERAVLYFGKLLFESDEKKFGFRGVES